MLSRAAIAALTLILAPPAARAADLVVWWEQGFYPEEDEAVRDIIAAFELGSGKQVELVFYPFDELPDRITIRFERGALPDFTFGHLLQDYVGQWAFDGRLADLSPAVGAFSNLFDADALAWVTWRDLTTGKDTLYGLPVGREINHVHVWAM